MSRFWSCDDAERLGTLTILWGFWEFQVSSGFRHGWWSSYLSPTMNHWHSHWQKPATSILRSPRESYNSRSSCKIKRTWAFFIFFALKMWLTWYQVVDHVWYFQSNMAKGMCSNDDGLSTKVSPFFDTPFPSSYWLMDTKSTSSIKHTHQPPSQNSPSIDPPPHRLRKDNVFKVRCHKLLSHSSVNSPIWLTVLDFTWLSLALGQVRQVHQVRHETLTGYLTGLDWAAVRQAPVVKSRGSVKAVLRAYFQICTNRWAQTIYSLQQLTSELARQRIIIICSSCLCRGSCSIFSGS